MLHLPLTADVEDTRSPERPSAASHGGLMTKRMKMSVFLASFAFLLMSPFLLEGQGTVYKTSLGVSFQGGYALPTDAFQDSHVAGGATFLIPLSPRLLLEVGADYARIPVRSQAEGLSQGRLIHISGLLGLRLRFPLRSLPLAPFLVVGAGYAFNSFSPDKAAVDTYRSLGFEVDETCRSAFAASAGTGLEVILSPKFVLDVRGLYRFSRTTSQWSITDQVTGKTAGGTVENVRLDAFLITAGFRLFF